MRTIGIVLGEHGGAIVAVERDDADALLVTAIERHPTSLAPVSGRVRALDDGETRFVIDGEGLGGALWRVLGEPTDKKRWVLYMARGVERQSLVDSLLVAVEQGHFRFQAGLQQQDAMNKALTSYRRQVRDDGIIGSELVVALLLAIIAPPRPSIYESRGLESFGGAS